ncbi:MAG: HD domain-containing protein [Hymenobacteraceae bacterium]|nr:HD domain-containing protein [Hymenobacteraceae bacterium]
MLRVRALLAVRAEGDVAHDAEHIRRVVTNARQLAASTGADERVVVPAAWLHDCVSVAKDSPQRTQASRLAATAADFLRASGYPATYIPAIEHAIEAHSFSAGIAPRTLEARVVQDADRLDTLGAVGIARHPDTSA